MKFKHDTKKPYFLIIYFFLLCQLLFPLTTIGDTKDVIDNNVNSKPNKIAVVISREIKPFMIMVKSLKSCLKQPVFEFFMDDSQVPKGRSGDFTKFRYSDFAVVVAVGPQALSYLTKSNIKIPVIYGMVLNPDKITKNRKDSCGVSLNIFSLDQFVKIHYLIPSITRIGIIYNPENNQVLFDNAKTFAKFAGIELIPLKVKNRSEISLHFKKRPLQIDAIFFIPDSTVISKTIIRYIIKQSLMYKIPTIGYNRFFYEEGSVLSFDIDYNVVGKQVANQVNLILDGKNCTNEQPNCKILLNEKVVKVLNLKIVNPIPEYVEVK